MVTCSPKKTKKTQPNKKKNQHPPPHKHKNQTPKPNKQANKNKKTMENKVSREAIAGSHLQIFWKCEN